MIRTRKGPNTTYDNGTVNWGDGREIDLGIQHGDNMIQDIYLVSQTEHI